MGKIIQASDCKCTNCGKPAVAFFPAFDPDIKAYPWCQKCLDKERFKLMVQIQQRGEEIKKKEKLKKPISTRC